MFPSQNQLLSRGLLLVLLALLLLAGCRRQPTSSDSAFPDLELILADLDSPDENTRVFARSNLIGLRNSSKGRSLTAEEGIKVVRAAAKASSSTSPEEIQARMDLLSFVAQDPRPEYVPVLVEEFDKFNDPHKTLALLMVGTTEGREAALAYMDIMQKHAIAGRIPRLPPESLEEKPHHGEIFFPELLRYATLPHLSMDIYQVCLAYCKAGLVPAKCLSPYTDQILTTYRAVAKQLRPAQKTRGVGWMWEEKYAERRSEGSRLLELLGYLPADNVERDLRGALGYHDPKLQYFAIASLLRHEKEVDAQSIEAVARHAEMRIELFELLREHGQSMMYPQKYYTQQAFAESDLVRKLATDGSSSGIGLINPAELPVPDEIEFMRVVTVDTGLPDGIYDYFLFRFRSHVREGAAKNFWMAGVSGPFPRKEAPSTKALDEAISSPLSADGEQPDVLLGDLGQLKERWREYHAQRVK